ncbi:MAG: hypothetical protein ACYSR7_01515 [Planctomycetota bacterium]|jgi:hypothetical protein
MKKKPSLIVDFDGVICEHRFPDVGEPAEGVQEALDTLRKAGFTVLLSIPAEHHLSLRIYSLVISLTG